MRDFPGAPVVKNPPCIAGAVGLIPDHETKIPHACHNYRSCGPQGKILYDVTNIPVPQVRPNTTKQVNILLNNSKIK